jgi:hypothetical protein
VAGSWLIFQYSGAYDNLHVIFRVQYINKYLLCASRGTLEAIWGITFHKEGGENKEVYKAKFFVGQFEPETPA